ncbi:hypothetical protein QX776_14090 [Alteromonadaceae bacterium BrNp21-10]|nr:hypothetical protein [Alteromonadaceae bacterium BrNp21-10]
MANKTISVFMRSIVYAVGLLGAIYAPTAASNIKVEAMLEGGYVNASYDKSWLNSWMEGGVGVLRFNRDDRFKVTQGIMQVSADVLADISFDAVAAYYPDGDSHLGFTEAYLTYAPLSAGLKHQVRVGMFYPKMSLENVDIGWTSPFTYSFSAINSWIAEELRTVGAEWSITRSGRAHHSPHSFTAVASLYRANDPVGTLLSWRGWALHNRQTTLNENVYFADYFQFQNRPVVFPDYLKPIEETDGRWGYYLGVQWRYLKSTDVRAYYYDNNADPLSIETNMQYGWDTRFTSVAIQHKFTSSFRVLAQWLDGVTYMGDINNGTFAEYNSWYLLGSYKWQNHRFSLRYDHFDVTDIDNNPMDPNDSNGHSITAAWRHNLNKHWNVGAEWLMVDSDNENRTLWPKWTAKNKQKQLMLLLQYRL